jgi:hypothetical protein
VHFVKEGVNVAQTDHYSEPNDPGSIAKSQKDEVILCVEETYQS